jgi:GNAT superfamily N-acetyltransferase
VSTEADVTESNFAGPKSITYRTGNELNLAATIDLYKASTLGERRPVADAERMAAMIGNADLLVWISRALSDFSYATYLSDLAVRVSHQRRGIGKELIRRTQEAAGTHVRIILLAAPASAEYYGHIGSMHHPRAWTLEPGQFVR